MTTPELKIANEVKLMVLTDRWRTADWDDAGNLVVTHEGLDYMVEVKAFALGNVD